MIAVNESARPPYVIFQERSVEDRTATLAAGRLVTKPIDWVIVRQAGNKDSSEFEVEVWFERISKNPGFMPEWVDGFRRMYSEWKKGQEPTPNGTAVRSWPAISPSQAEMLVACQVLTIEDLAAANEPTLQRIGMGARDLKLKAKAWLDSAQTIGTVAEELAALRSQVAALMEQNIELRGKVHALQPAAPLPAAPAATEVDPFGE